TLHGIVDFLRRNHPSAGTVDSQNNSFDGRVLPEPFQLGDGGLSVQDHALNPNESHPILSREIEVGEQQIQEQQEGDPNPCQKQDFSNERSLAQLARRFFTHKGSANRPGGGAGGAAPGVATPLLSSS